MVSIAPKCIIMMKKQTMKEKKINTAVEQNDMSYKQGFNIVLWDCEE